MNKKEYLPISCIVNSSDFTMFKSVIDQGIDSYLEGFTKSSFEIKKAEYATRLYMNFHNSELPILIRRLQELYTGQSDMWAMDILDAQNSS